MSNNRDFMKAIKHLTEIITNIEEISDYKFDGSFYSLYDGYKVTTDKRMLFVLVSNGQCWCENWGQVASDDSLNDYIGAELISVEEVDSSYNTNVAEFAEGGECTESVFVNFNTNKGTFQLVVYNHHNGYYGHDVVFIENRI